MKKWKAKIQSYLTAAALCLLFTGAFLALVYGGDLFLTALMRLFGGE